MTNAPGRQKSLRFSTIAFGPFLWRVYLVFVPVFKATTSGWMEISWTGKGKTVKFFVVVELPLCRVSLWGEEIYFPLCLDCKCPPPCVWALGPQTVALLQEAAHVGGKTSLEKGCHCWLVLGFKTCPHFSGLGDMFYEVVRSWGILIALSVVTEPPATMDSLPWWAFKPWAWTHP